MRPSRTTRVMNGDVLVEVLEFDTTWDELRALRDRELVRTDPWAMKDRTMSQDKKDYRTFLRDLPGNHDDANSGLDAWAAYEIPE